MKFVIGDLVRKIKGSSWQGRICGTYSTELTPEGYCVESTLEPGSVQLYPAAALEEVKPQFLHEIRRIEWLVTIRPCDEFDHINFNVAPRSQKQFAEYHIAMQYRDEIATQSSVNHLRWVPKERRNDYELVSIEKHYVGVRNFVG